MEKKRRKFSLLLIATAVLLVAVIATLYINRLNMAIYDSTLSQVEELTDHDMLNIAGFVETSYRELREVGKRVMLHESGSLDECIDQLTSEIVTSKYANLYLVDTVGTLYCNNQFVKDGTGAEFVQRLLSTDEQVAIRWDDSDYVKERQECILFGVRIPSFTVDGVEFVAVAGSCDILSIRTIWRLAVSMGVVVPVLLICRAITWSNRA